MTVFKTAFLASLRAGSGVVVARLEDGSWSAPSFVTLGGAGLGSQLGIELIDFVFILNDHAAVRTYAGSGTISLGGNVSIAAGPVGRNAEAAGAVSSRGAAAIFTYSKTQGLFAGVSLEGSYMGTRNDVNAKVYRRSNLTPSELLDGSVPPTPVADPLMRILRSRVFAPPAAPGMFNDRPVYDDRHDDVIWEGRRGDGFGEGILQSPSARRKTWADDVARSWPPGYPSINTAPSPARASTFSDATASRRVGGTSDGLSYLRRDQPPGRPTAAKPIFEPRAASTSTNLGPDQVRAKFRFDADQPGDLSFRKGDIITVVKRTDSLEDWWTGRIGPKEGIFPSNYVEVTSF